MTEFMSLKSPTYAKGFRNNLPGIERITDQWGSFANNEFDESSKAGKPREYVCVYRYYLSLFLF